MLFNFAVSYSGGGFKRLYAFAKWFNQRGGASFIIHPSCFFLKNEFKNNDFICVSQSQLQRLFNDCNYLTEIIKTGGIPDLYYSYGIPIYHEVGKINWFHLSNVLPLALKGIPLSLLDKLKFKYLGKKIKKNFKNAKIISAESSYSLSLIGKEHTNKLFVSVNGSDDEIEHYHPLSLDAKEKIALVIGTYSYKALVDSYQVFKMLHARDKQLKLIILGNEKNVPNVLRNDPDIFLTGNLPRSEVINYLRKSHYYISTTYIENSYNAAAEGIFFANESFISNIGPHQELVKGMNFETILVPNVNRTLLHLKREEITLANLKSWDEVISEMVDHISNDIDF